MKIGSTKYSDGGFVKMSSYSDGSPAIQIIDGDGQPQMKATVNMSPEEPAEGCVFLKGWSENEGVIEALVAAKVVGLTGRKVKAGYAFALEAQLLITNGE